MIVSCIKMKFLWLYILLTSLALVFSFLLLFTVFRKPIVDDISFAQKIMLLSQQEHVQQVVFMDRRQPSGAASNELLHFSNYGGIENNFLTGYPAFQTEILQSIAYYKLYPKESPVCSPKFCETEYPTRLFCRDLTVIAGILVAVEEKSHKSYSLFKMRYVINSEITATKIKYIYYTLKYLQALDFTTIKKEDSHMHRQIVELVGDWTYRMENLLTSLSKDLKINRNALRLLCNDDCRFEFSTAVSVDSGRQNQDNL